MNSILLNKKKIFNDPVYGFINITDEIIFNIIEHPYFQRLRRIKQLGLSHLVYPGALHTRFQHAIGTMYLMTRAIEVLRSKGHKITSEEALASSIAILLHDIGHGPFSHTLENCIVYDITHEDLSELFMDKLNKIFKGKLSLAISIFKGNYHKKFLHQLISSQLDMDRLDYLRRDSFYTGISEGLIGSDRIIKMLDIADDNLVIESKGIYSIEHFIIARRFMYWQVYLHKTVLSAEFLLIKILKRAKYIAEKKEILFTTPALKMFLYNKFNKTDFINNESLLDNFSQLDDFDILTSIKVWTKHKDKILSSLCQNLINRNLFKVETKNRPFEKKYVDKIKKHTQDMLKLNEQEINYFVFLEKITNNAYNPQSDKINILYKNGDIIDIACASDQLNVSVLSKIVTKYFLYYPKQCAVDNI